MQSDWKVLPDKLQRELEHAAIPVDYVLSGGEIFFRPEATEAHKKQAEKILAAHDPRDRRQAYNEAFSMDEFIEAYMEANFEERPEKLQALQTKREAVKKVIK